MRGSLAGAVGDPWIPEADAAVARVVVKKVRMEIKNTEAYTAAMAQLIYLNIRLQDRRQLHPPTRLRAEYQQQYHDVKRNSIAKQTTENGSVVWQVCVSPAQMLEEGVVKPAVWEAVPRKYAATIEYLFLGRSSTQFTLETGGLSVNLVDYTIDYGGKGPRPLRRLVNRYITHEASFPKTYAQLVADVEATARQLDHLNAKLNALQSSSLRKRSTITSTVKK
ncbi:unnamed protein product [Phytomonas sp. EM1]|nr:unnamed protein product [Phytomonas sp. EM1]|eukprot:CCW64359.1 unnamed protein product [Phytomonas sp. isolate EM1]